jgi:hypothetical protein
MSQMGQSLRAIQMLECLLSPIADIALACRRSTWPPVTPIALRDFARDRLFALFQLAFLALPGGLIVVGDDAQALFVARRGLCLKLGMPIGTGTKRQHEARRAKRGCRWWPGQDRPGL